MILDMTYKPTRYSCVFWRGDSLYFTYRDPQRRKIEVRYGEGTPADARTAQRIAQENADAIRQGVKDPRQARAEQASRAPITALIAEYGAHIGAAGGDAQHVKTVKRYIERWVTAAKIERITEADPAQLVRWLSEQKWSARSQNYARSSILGMTRWAAEYHRAPYNPCTSRLVPKMNEDADRRRQSSALTPPQFQDILDAAPLDRFTYYLVLANTGLRWRELRRLEWSDFDAEAGLLTVPASAAKNDKRADLPLAPPVVAAMEAWRRHRGASVRIFDREPRLKTWRRDLVRAGIVRPYCTLGAERREVWPGYVDERGRRFDRKCLRLSFGTWLKDQGADLRDTQRLMRHSDPKLTSNIYTDPRMAPLRAAVERLSTTNQPADSKLSEALRHSAGREKRRA